MNFIKKIWKDYPDTSTPITAAELNRIEDGIIEAMGSGGSSGYTDIYSESSINYGRALVDDEPQIPGEGSVAFGELLIATGLYSHAEGRNNKATNTGSHAEGAGNEATGIYAHAEGTGTKATEGYSHAEGNGTKANGFCSHAEGSSAETTGNFSHAEGSGSKANGQASHTEGMSTSTDSGAMASHAEGSGSKAKNTAAHAEGYQTEAKGMFSHSEGMNTITNDIGSHAEGLGTIAFESYQHVEGRYNKTESSSVPLLKVIGNGTSDTSRSNAHTLDIEGNAWFAGDVQNGIGDRLSNKLDVPDLPEIIDGEYILGMSIKDGVVQFKWKLINESDDINSFDIANNMEF